MHDEDSPGVTILRHDEVHLPLSQRTWVPLRGARVISSAEDLRGNTVMAEILIGVNDTRLNSIWAQADARGRADPTTRSNSS
jgi:hypothetical protein